MPDCQLVQVPGYTAYKLKSTPGYQLGTTLTISIASSKEACDSKYLCKVGGSIQLASSLCAVQLTQGP